MRLAYFDENKYSDDNPFFYIGGIIIDENIAKVLEEELTVIQKEFFGNTDLVKQYELHGKDIFHGKGNCRGRAITERLQVFDDVSQFLILNKIPIRMVCIDVVAHNNRYSNPVAEYTLGLMLILERFCDYLDKVDELGIIFGDYEKDEMAKSVVNFSKFKSYGTTPYYSGRSVERLIDTIYFTQSHHSRFLQITDLIVYMAGRIEKPDFIVEKWHDQRLFDIWNKIKANGDFKIQRWP